MTTLSRFEAAKIVGISSSHFDRLNIPFVMVGSWKRYPLDIVLKAKNGLNRKKQEPTDKRMKSLVHVNGVGYKAFARSVILTAIDDLEKGNKELRADVFSFFDTEEFELFESVAEWEGLGKAVKENGEKALKELEKSKCQNKQ